MQSPKTPDTPEETGIRAFIQRIDAALEAVLKTWAAPEAVELTARKKGARKGAKAEKRRDDACSTATTPPRLLSKAL
jgi:hypothetical protein